MPTSQKMSQPNWLLIAGVLGATGLMSAVLLAQGPQARIAAEIDNSQRVTIAGSHPPKASQEFDTGRVPADTKLQSVSMVFNRSAAQEADLQTLIAAQQDPSSPQYHKWLTPEEFAARFGMTDADISKAAFWLQQQGLTIDGSSRSKTRLNFSGTVQQVEAAFSTEIHYYTMDGEKHFAPASDVSVPAALAPVVLTIDNLSTFRPKPRVKFRSTQAPSPKFTSSQSGSHFLTPGDIATIYDVKPAYQAGITGSGQSIAVVGQSSIALSDIKNFQSAAGLAQKDPTEILVPGTGAGAVSQGDEMESDIDLEYSGGTAPGATIVFVYVGSNNNANVLNALVYAIDNRTAPIISISYGACESDTGQTEYNSLNATLAQAATQGQTILTAAGDNGSTDCSGNTNQSTTAQEALAVDFPSSSQYVTAMGGSEFLAADVAIGNTAFWQAAPNSTTDAISSALSYIPEMAWNDDALPQGSTAASLSSGGGGVSMFTARPSWQTGVPGIPSGSFRLLPDVSLTASPNNAGFLYCSSDPSTTITGSCSHGFRDTNNSLLTVAGGTSFDAPTFAGMVALLNQKLNSSGQGVINPALYKLASNSATYASAFHDITAGSNECLAGTSLCSAVGVSEYPATTGYDEATGLGSVDFNNLLSAFGSGSGSSSNSFTLTATNLTVADGSSGASTITVTPQAGFTGTISFTATPPIANACFLTPTITVSGSSAVTGTLMIDTSSQACAAAELIPAPGGRFEARAAGFFAALNGFWSAATSNGPSNGPIGWQVGASLAFSGLLIVGLLCFRSRRAATCSALFLLAAAGVVVAGCGGGGSGSSTTATTGGLAAKGTYTLTIVGTDTSSSSITATTTATLTIK
jgi:subtilase family serine protease